MFMGLKIFTFECFLNFMLDLSQVAQFPTTSFTVLDTGFSFFEKGM